MNNNYSSSLNVGGGGNSLNLVRIPSLDEMKNIITKSDLNGSITPWNVNVWHFTTNHFNWLQNNGTTQATTAEIAGSWLRDSIFPKNTTIINASWPFVFRPIIEFRE